MKIKAKTGNKTYKGCMKTQENKNKRCESKNRKNDRVQYVEHGLSVLH